MRPGMQAELVAEVSAFAGPLALFSAMLLPGVAFWDTGEMQTVPAILGIAHPTGFPAFVLLGWLFAHGVPAGTPAWRLSLFSACAAAAGAWLLYRCVRALVRDRGVALAAALAYAAGDIVWTRAARAEVHDLALGFTTLALTLAFEAGRSGSARKAIGTGAAAGCGLATHPVVALALPSVALLAWPALMRLGARAWAALALATLGPLVSYAYLPLRSADVVRHARDPALALGLPGGAFWNYDDPATPARFWHYALGGAFSPAEAFARAATQPGFAHVLAFARSVAQTEFGVVAAALVVTGFAYLAFAATRVALAFAVLSLATAAFAANFPVESDPLRYALPALWAAGVCAGAGAAWVMQALCGERSPAASALAAALLAVALWPNALYAARDASRQRKTDDARAFIAEFVQQTQDRSLIVATWTFATPLGYAAFVAHSLGSRTVVSGWPDDYAERYGNWRGRFSHIYFVLPAHVTTPAFAVRRYTTARWQLAELHP